MNKIKLASKLISQGWRLSICEKSLLVAGYDSDVKKRDFFAMPHTRQSVVSFDYYTYPVSFVKMSQHNNDVGVMLHQHSPEIVYCFFQRPLSSNVSKALAIALKERKRSKIKNQQRIQQTYKDFRSYNIGLGCYNIGLGGYNIGLGCYNIGQGGYNIGLGGYNIGLGGYNIALDVLTSIKLALM